MKFTKELYIQAPIEFVYEYLRDFEQLHECEVVKFHYDHLNAGSRSIAVLKGEGKHRLHYRGETLFAEYPSSYIEKSILSSKNMPTVTTVTTVDLTKVEEGTKIQISQHIAYIPQTGKINQPSHKIMEQQEQLWATYKQKIEQAYQQNPEVKRKLPSKSKVSTAFLDRRWDREKWKRSIYYYPIVLLVSWELGMDIFHRDIHLHDLLFPAIIVSIFYEYKSNRLSYWLVVVAVLLMQIEPSLGM